MKAKHIPLLLLNIIIIIISFYLVFLFFKSKTFHNYPCYNMIILSFIILIDNILRIIPINKKDGCNAVENVFAYFIVFFDKLILATLSMQSLIYYFGVLKTDFYSANEAKIFYITLLCSLVISGSLAGYYISQGTTSIGDSYYCYCTDTGYPKKIIDDIFNSIYLLISIYCSIIPLNYISHKKKEVKNGLIDDLNYSHHFNRILITLLLNILTFVVSFLIIYDKFPGDYVDLIYLVTCLVVALFNCLNEEVYKETLKIFCKKKYNKKYNLIKTQKTNFDDDDDED